MPGPFRTGSFRISAAVIPGFCAFLVACGTTGRVVAQDFPVDNLGRRGDLGCCGESAHYPMPYHPMWWHRPLLPLRPWMPWKRARCGYYDHFDADSSPYAMTAPGFGGEACCQGSTWPGGYNDDGLYVPGGGETAPYPPGGAALPVLPGEAGRIHAKPVDPASPTLLQPQPDESNWQPMPRSLPEKIEIPNVDPMPMPEAAPKAKEAPLPKDAKLPVLRSTSGMFRPVPGAARAWQAVSQATPR